MILLLLQGQLPEDGGFYFFESLCSLAFYGEGGLSGAAAIFTGDVLRGIVLDELRRDGML